jgi:diaminohydroxyphosphoribosylaminopyrimidine deaminase/5-amino-6-(5-phosphoribosylamino)uracil reductase
VGKVNQQSQRVEALRTAMLYANQLAEKGLGRTFPNPIVGAVVVNAAGQVISEGFHERSGGNHAEVNALAGAGNQAKVQL